MENKAAGKKEASTSCLIPGCKNLAETRGQCGTDYRSSLKMIRDGKTTWKELEKEGLALPSGRQQSRVARALKRAAGGRVEPAPSKTKDKPRRASKGGVSRGAKEAKSGSRR